MALSPKDLTLIEAAHAGDPTALDHLPRLCQPDIRRYAQRHCLISDIDDAVQETLLILSHKLAGLRGLVSLSGWLFRVVQRECRHMGRKMLNYDPYDEETLERWLTSRSDETLALELRDALGSLPAHYRDVILLRDLEQFTIGEIADRLGLTRATVKARLNRARTLTREYLLGDPTGVGIKH